LSGAGHDVAVWSKSTEDELARPGYPFRAALTASTGMGSGPREFLEEFQPDIVYLHSTFRNIGSNWLRQSGHKDCHSPSQSRRLTAMARSQMVTAAAQRARIVLLAADGVANAEIARGLG
jgi:hypothetical protein